MIMHSHDPLARLLETINQATPLSFTQKAAYAQKHGLNTLPGFLVTVAGTNGKGSMAYALERLACAHQCSVMTFTSPHLVSVCERIRIDGQAISAEVLFACLSDLPQVTSLGYFTALFFAFVALAQRLQPQLIIVEAGIGGELDISNLLDADLLYITSIAYDHCDILGDTLQAISQQKAGLMRRGKPVIYAGSVLARPFIKACATLRGAHLRCYEEDFMPLQLAASLPCNVLSAAWATRQYLPFKHDDELDKQVLSQLSVPGRCQHLIYCGVHLVLDVAHNPEAVARLASHLSTPSVMLCAFKQDKMLDLCLKPLLSMASAWHLPQINDTRMLTTEVVARQLKELTDRPIMQYQDVNTALDAALAAQQAESIVIFGSFTIVGAVLGRLSKEGASGL